MMLARVMRFSPLATTQLFTVANAHDMSVVPEAGQLLLGHEGLLTVHCSVVVAVLSIPVLEPCLPLLPPILPVKLHIYCC
jgi:hypothetical protein